MADATDWPAAATALWGRLTAYPFEHPQDGLDLTGPLAREQGWTLEQARAAIDEYRRFCFLCGVAGETMTPSREVAAVWHLHLTATRDYWERFCPQVLGAPLHHEPTGGGATAGPHEPRQYARTLAAYERWFGPPPLAFWPGTRERFADPARWRLVDRQRVLILPRPRLSDRRGWLAHVGVVVLVLFVPLSPNPLHWIAVPAYFWLLFLLFSSPWAVGLWRSRRLRDRLRETCAGRADGLDPWQLAYLAGGPDRAIDAAVAHLLTQGAAQFDPNAGRLRLTEPACDLPASLAELGAAIAGDGRPAALRRNATRWLEPLRSGLVLRGLALSAEAFQGVRQSAMMPFVAIAIFEAGKIPFALSQGWVLGSLIALLVTLGAAGMARWRSSMAPIRTRGGDRALEDARGRCARAARAPTTDEVGLAVALGGVDALPAGALAGYRGVAPSFTADA